MGKIDKFLETIENAQNGLKEFFPICTQYLELFTDPEGCGNRTLYIWVKIPATITIDEACEKLDRFYDKYREKLNMVQLGISLHFGKR